MKHRDLIKKIKKTSMSNIEMFQIQKAILDKMSTELESRNFNKTEKDILYRHKGQIESIEIWHDTEY